MWLCRKVYSGESQWTQVTLSNQNEQRHPASDLAHQVANFISIYSQPAKPEGLQKKNLLKDCNSVIQSILKKLREKSPLNFNLVRNAACLVTLNIIQKRNISVSKFGKLVTNLYVCKHINAEEADQSKDQFESFVDSEAKKSAEAFSKYDVVNEFSKYDMVNDR